MNIVAIAYAILNLLFLFLLIWMSVYIVMQIWKEIKK
jgi:hypothetical protein